MSFGRRLKEARLAKRLTQSDAAEKLGIDDTTISKYENNKSEPDFQTTKKMAEFYDVPVDVLLGIEYKDAIDKLIAYLNLELTNEEIKERLKFKVDNITLSSEEVDEFIQFVRVKRLMKKM